MLCSKRKLIPMYIKAILFFIFIKMNISAKHVVCNINHEGIKFCRIGDSPICNPVPSECPAGTKYLNNDKYPSYNATALYPGNTCSVGYSALCTSTNYSFLSSWMFNSINKTDGRDPRKFLDKPLNTIFLPGSHDTMAYGINQTGDIGLLRFGSDASMAEINSIIVYIPKSLGIIATIITNWAKAQQVSLISQLNAGIRYLDMRLCLDTNNGLKIPTFQDLKFTHSLISDITLMDAMLEIAEFHRKNKGEIIIIDFQYILNLCTTNINLLYYVPAAEQLKIQKQMLDFIENLFGQSLSSSEDAITNSYNYFTSKKSPIIVLFDGRGAGGQGGISNAIVPEQGNSLAFPEYWNNKGYKWVRNRQNVISATMGNVYNVDSNPIGSWKEAKCMTGKTCYETYTDNDKFIVFGATVGITLEKNARQIRCGNFCPELCYEHPIDCGSNINYASSMAEQSANFAPVLLNSLLDRWGYMYKGGFFTEPINPPIGIGTHNIYLYDNIDAFNVASIIVAANRGELSKFV